MMGLANPSKCHFIDLLQTSELFLRTILETSYAVRVISLIYLSLLGSKAMSFFACTIVKSSSGSMTRWTGGYVSVSDVIRSGLYTYQTLTVIVTRFAVAASICAGQV